MVRQGRGAPLAVAHRLPGRQLAVATQLGGEAERPLRRPAAPVLRLPTPPGEGQEVQDRRGGRTVEEAQGRQTRPLPDRVGEEEADETDAGGGEGVEETAEAEEEG